MGVANLSTNYRDAFGTDFQNARGYFLLDAPTATDQSDSINGVWFMKSILPPTAGLMNLPPLSEGWKYEGWIIAQCATTPEHPLTHFFQTGTFQTSAGFDGDSAGPTRGMNGNGYPFPGQDFIQDIRLDFKSHCLSVMVTIEPDDVAVPFTPMILFKSTLIPTSLRRGQSVQMQNNAANFPTAKITLVR